MPGAVDNGTKSMFNPLSWSGSAMKLIGDIKDDDPIDQTDLRIVASLGFIGGAALQGNRANKRIRAAADSGVPAVPFKYLLM